MQLLPGSGIRFISCPVRSLVRTQVSRFVHSVKAAIGTHNKTLFVIEFIVQLTSK